jgi:hypothetical protein
MLMRISTFVLGPNTGATAERAADATARLLKGNPECVSYSFIGDYAKGEYGLVSIWRNREAAEAASKQNEPAMVQMLGPHLKARPSVRFYDIYKPKP